MEHFQDHITPPLCSLSSPELDPLDCYVWSIVERFSETVHSQIDEDHFIRACQIIMSRIEDVIEADGDFIE